jgi:4'-phosphopantetheinyl transferase
MSGSTDHAQVDVWALPLGGEDPAASEALLSPAERARARRLRGPTARRRYVVAHASLRRVLAGYVGREPAAIELTAGRAGKPELVDSGGLRFSLSHTRELALCAVARREVGVDVEYMAAGRDLVALARRAFGPPEGRRLAALAPDARRAAFYESWTGMEAVLKCRGVGIGGDAARAALGLEIRSLGLGDGYAGAIAVEADSWVLRRRRVG